MNSATCAALTAVFPLILLAATQQRRDMHLKIRRLRFTRWVLHATMSACLIGLLYSVVGVQLRGFTGPAAVLGWLLIAVATASFGYVIVAIHASLEQEEDEADRA